MYLVSFKISESQVSDSLLALLGDMGDSIALFPNTRILDTNMAASDVFDKLYKIIKPSDQFIVIPFELANIQGFINSNVIDWMRQREGETKEAESK